MSLRLYGIASLSLVLVSSLQPPSASAASRFGPPTEMMLDRYNKVAVAVAEEGSAPNKIRFTRVEAIRGEVPEEWEARVEMDDLSDIEWGETYIVAFTEVRRNPLDRETRELDPEGPRVLELPVLGAVILRDSDHVRSMLETIEKRQEELGRGYLDSVMALLGGSDERLRRFSISEFYLRQALYEYLEAGDHDVIEAAAASDDVAFEPRAMLLEASQRFPEAVQGDWPESVARQIVASAGTDLDLESTEPLLVKTSLEVLLGAEAKAGDREAIARQLSANAPGVVKAALATLAEMDPELAAERARQALEVDELHPSARAALESYLRRYESDSTG